MSTNFHVLYLLAAMVYFVHNALGKDMGMTTEMNTLLAAEAIEKSCYTDDLIPSVPTVEQPTEMRRQLTELRDKANFHIRKWISNRPEVIAGIPEKDRASEIDLDRNESPTTKTLGVLWRHQMTTHSCLPTHHHRTSSKSPRGMY